jgi:hypothetical protein
MKQGAVYAENIAKGFKKMTAMHLDWSKGITMGLQGIMSLSMAINSLSGAWDTLSDPDLSGWDKFKTLSLSLSMGLMMLISSFKSISPLLLTFSTSFGSLMARKAGYIALSAGIVKATDAEVAAMTKEEIMKKTGMSST